jgi:hypothetical protein
VTRRRHRDAHRREGVVVQHVGRVVIGPDGPISLSGKFPEFEAAYNMNQDFCAAIS